MRRDFLPRYLSSWTAKLQKESSSVLALNYSALRYTWSVAFALLVLGVIYLIREALFVFVVALLFAYLLWPLVNFFDRRLPGRSRAPALAIVYLSLVALLIIIGIATGSRVMIEANALASSVPISIAKLKHPAASLSPAVPTLKSTLVSIARLQLIDHSERLLSRLPDMTLNILTHAGNLFYVVLVPILSFFLMKDGREITREILGALAEGPRRDIFEIGADLNLLLAQYMRALVLLGVATFAAYAMFLSLIGVPYALLLAAVAFPLEFIPMVGPLAAAIIILTVAGLSGFQHLLWILVFMLAFRIVQDYVLSPHLLSAGMQLHPIVVLFGVLAGGAIAGIPGIFLSVPVLATLRIIYRQLRKRPLEFALRHPESTCPLGTNELTDEGLRSTASM
jgi:predicted PurR-regulated permease PerM